MTERPRAKPHRAFFSAFSMERLPGTIGQLVLLAAVAWMVWHGIANFLGNARALGVSMGFGFLRSEAGFEIAQSMISFGPASSYRDAIVVATLNSLLVIVLASLLGTLIALCVAFGRLSTHPLIRGASSLYVEVFRNIPMLLQIFFWYFSALALLPGVGDSYELGAVLLNNRGLFLPRLLLTPMAFWALTAALAAFVALFIALVRAVRPRFGPLALAFFGAALLALCLAPLIFIHAQFGLDRPAVEGFNVGGGFALLPELIALTLGLSIYNSTFLAEIFRAGILSVPRGQIEAAATVGLTGVRAALLVTLPQALRLALPPAAGQYQTLAKASSLAAAIGYPDIMQIVGGTVLSQTGQALEAMALVVLLYAAINLVIALVLNLANRRLLRAERR
ncbi:MAG: amine acid transporter, permease protein region, His/Glu/Gln/Arg/opine family [Variovorax sp.]|jgi:general L-amino acid transport system permease protein|nr:amine acid transporter, permease protein region, His/Glu/Gln/Arg/opine family [Variovorax sp.]